MAENLYADDDEPNPNHGGDEVESQNEGAMDDSEKGAENPVLVNSEVCPGMKPGDKLPLRVLRVHEGEYECAYEPEGKEDGGESDDMTDPGPGPMAGMLD